VDKVFCFINECFKCGCHAITHPQFLINNKKKNQHYSRTVTCKLFVVRLALNIFADYSIQMNIGLISKAE